MRVRGLMKCGFNNRGYAFCKVLEVYDEDRKKFIKIKNHPDVFVHVSAILYDQKFEKGTRVELDIERRKDVVDSNKAYKSVEDSLVVLDQEKIPLMEYSEEIIVPFKEGEKRQAC